MNRDELFAAYNADSLHRQQAIFASLFILQNRLQTSGEKIQTEISMKQRLLLAMMEACSKPCTLTKLGIWMGCSRQNVKKLAAALEKKGFVRLVQGKGNAISIDTTEKADQYLQAMSERHAKTMQLLFSKFSEAEIEQLFHLDEKLYAGMERVEEYARTLETKEK